MCKKLIILCVALVVVGLSVPASALFIGEPSGCANPLYVDIDGGGTASPQPGCGYWQPWQFARDWTGPITKQFANPLAAHAWEYPIAQLETYRAGIVPNNSGLSRDRSGGFTGVAGTGEYSCPDTGGKGLGTSYVKLTITQLKPDTEYLFKLWSYEAFGVWSSSSANPNSKYGVWSTTNPLAKLIEHGDPCGYCPLKPTCLRGASGMPDYLAESVLACGAEGGRTFMMAPINDNNDYLGGAAYCVSFYAKTSAEDPDSGDPGGAITIYGWIDATDWSGSMHMPLNGFEVIPEPATVALLGLGGLALLRRKRA